MWEVVQQGKKVQRRVGCRGWLGFVGGERGDIPGMKRSEDGGVVSSEETWFTTAEILLGEVEGNKPLKVQQVWKRRKGESTLSVPLSVLESYECGGDSGRVLEREDLASLFSVD